MEIGSRCRVRARTILMDLRIQDKTAVVTGSTAGIGLAIASLLASEGADVVVNGRTRERVDETVERIAKACPKAKIRGVAADLSTAAGVRDFVRDS